MLETAAEADHAGVSVVGRGLTRRWRALYARAEVEEGRARAGARVRRTRKVRRVADMVGMCD